jgi:hypothetical protein
MQQRHMLSLSSVAVCTYGSRVEVTQPCGVWFPLWWFGGQAMVIVSGGSGGADHQCDVDKSVSRGFWKRGGVL